MVTFTFFDSEYKKYKSLKTIYINVLKLIEKFEKCKVLSVDVFFLTQEQILELNIKTFNHDYPTDIITINYSNQQNIICELFLCPDVIEYNSIIYDVDNTREFLRVLVHGVLHCCGYDDDNEEQIFLMRSKEDFYLTKCFT